MFDIKSARVMKGPSLAYPLRLLSHERPHAVPRAEDDHGLADTIDWASIDDDLAIVRRTKANLLVTGSECLVMQVIRRVVADAPAIIVIPCEAGRLPLSPLPLPPGILVFRDVDRLDGNGQAVLLEWLDSVNAERPIVSTASASLLPLVHSAAFDPGLYYRVNTIYIGLGQ